MEVRSSGKTTGMGKEEPSGFKVGTVFQTEIEKKRLFLRILSSFSQAKGKASGRPERHSYFG